MSFHDPSLSTMLPLSADWLPVEKGEAMPRLDYDFDIDRTRAGRPVARFRSPFTAAAFAEGPWTLRAWLGAAGFVEGASGLVIPPGLFDRRHEAERAAVLARLEKAPTRHLARLVRPEWFVVRDFVADACRARPMSTGRTMTGVRLAAR